MEENVKQKSPIILYVAATVAVGLVAGLLGVLLQSNASKPSAVAAGAGKTVEAPVVRAAKSPRKVPSLSAVPLEVSRHKNPDAGNNGISFSSDDYRGTVKVLDKEDKPHFIVSVNGVERFNGERPTKELKALLDAYPAVRPLLQNAPYGYRLTVWARSRERISVEELRAALEQVNNPEAVQWALSAIAEMPPEQAAGFAPELIRVADVYLPLPLGGLAAVKKVGLAAIPHYHQALPDASPVQATNIAQFILALGNPAVPHIVEFIDLYEDNPVFLNALSRYFLFESRQFTAANRQLVKERLNLIPLPELPEDVAYALNTQPSFTAIELKKVNDGILSSDWQERGRAISMSAAAATRLTLAQKEQIMGLLAGKYVEDKEQADPDARRRVLITYHNAFSKIGALPPSILSQFRADMESGDPLLKGLSAAQLLVYGHSETYRDAFFESLSDSRHVDAHIPQLVKASPKAVEHLAQELQRRFGEAESVEEQGLLLVLSDILLRRDSEDPELAGQAANVDGQVFGRIPTAKERHHVRKLLHPLVEDISKLLSHRNDDLRVLAATVVYRVDPGEGLAKVILRACAKSAPLAEKKNYCSGVLKDKVAS